MKIAKLQEVLLSARVIDRSKLDNSRVTVLSNVKVRNLKSGKDMLYTLVPASESDFRSGKISIDSPVGQGLMGGKVGDRVDIQVPAGSLPFEIIEIS